MAKLPRRLCRPTAYRPMTFDWAAEVFSGEFGSTSAMKIVSVGFDMPESFVLVTLTPPGRLMHSLPFSPYMKNARVVFGGSAYGAAGLFGAGQLGHEKIVRLLGRGGLGGVLL